MTVSEVDKLQKEIREKYGKGVVRTGAQVAPPKRVSTGVESLDKILSGGWPESRIIEIWGPDGVGKSTLCCTSVAAVQRAGGTVVWFDQENNFEPIWAKKHGVDLDKLTVYKPMAGEDVGKMILAYIRQKVAMVVLDSIPIMMPERDLDKEVEEDSVAPIPRLLGKLIPKIILLQGDSPTVLLTVNQVRSKIGFHMGSDERGPGGKTYAHGVSVRLKVRRKGFLGKDRKKPTGYEMAALVLKSKVGGERRETVIMVSFENGIEGGYEIEPEPDAPYYPEEERDA